MNPKGKKTLTKGAHGQPLFLTKLNLENNVSKALDQISGVCAGILADGVVTDEEAKFFREFIKRFNQYEPVWPLSDIIARIDNFFKQETIDDNEREELKMIMESLCGKDIAAQPAKARSASFPLDEPQPVHLEFAGKVYRITGRFAYGTRSKVLEAITTLGAEASDAPPNKETNYLAIGTFASRDWYHTNFGRKIERATELRQDGFPICIISEETLRPFLP